MYHGMNPSNGDGFLEQQLQQQQPQSPQRLLAVILWFQLALCFGPAQLTGGFDDLNVCADPGVPENGFRTPSGGVFFESSVTRFHCQDGFRLKGSTKRLCMKHFNGTLGWVPSDKPVCIQEDCRIPQIEDAEIRNKTYRHGEKLVIDCHEGFKIRYPDLYNLVSLCRDDGTWDNLPICQGCLRPLASSNGYVNISEFQTSFPVGTVIAYRCFPGFKLEGSENLECLHNLIWSSSPPRCLALEDSSLTARAAFSVEPFTLRAAGGRNILAPEQGREEWQRDAKRNAALELHRKGSSYRTSEQRTGRRCSLPSPSLKPACSGWSFLLIRSATPTAGT